jgi:tRNA-dihydrouridine synthase A
MLKPDLVAECVQAMRSATSLPVTVKCRVGIDYGEEYEFFQGFVAQVASAGVDALIVHARNAVLTGLSPKENREIPPLKYDFVHRLKRERPDLTVVLNGVMLGRAAYHRPELLAELHRLLVDPAWRVPEPWAVVEQMIAYAKERAADGVRLHSVTRHMHGVMAGREGARAWRRFLSEIASCPDARPEMLDSALPIVRPGLAA